MADMGGCYAITTGGQIVAFLWNKENQLEPENNTRLCRIAMHRGSLLYPILAPFVPQRPADAFDCLHCVGTGRVAGIPDDVADNVVCSCGRLGWLLKGEDRA